MNDRLIWLSLVMYIIMREIVLFTKKKCKAMPTKDANGVDTYDNSNYNAPVLAVIGMAGFALDNFTTDVSCSLSLMYKSCIQNT